MSTREIRAIDVHAHYGVYRRGINALVDRLISGDGKCVEARAAQANTRLSIVSPLSGLLPRGCADSVAGNEEAERVVAQADGLLQWVIVNPLQPRTYEQAAAMLRRPKCAGIKIHPEEHGYPILEHGDEIFEFASRCNAVVLTHSGDEHSWPRDFIDFSNRYPNVPLILAHLGNGGSAAGDPTLQVRAIQEVRHENVFVDTSSARSIMSGLIEWAVSEIGSPRILYGTDTPLYFAASQRARIDYAEISDDDKRNILCANAERVFQLTGTTPARRASEG